MDEIRMLGVRFLQMLLNALFLPVIVLLVLAAINDRIRRITLYAMLPITLFALLMYALFSRSDPNLPQDWDTLMQSMGDAVVAALPYLIGLLALGIAAFLFGPYLVEVWGTRMDNLTRRRYLQQLIAYIEAQGSGRPGIPGAFDLAGQRAALAGVYAGKTTSLRLVGEAGAGKSAVLRSAAVELARQALEKDYLPLPLLMDLDVLLTGEPDIDRKAGAFSHPPSLVALQPVRLPLLERMLRREARRRKLCFLIDGSLHTFAPGFLSPEDRSNLLNDLAGMAEYFTPCPFIIALPPGLSAPALTRMIDAQVVLEPLDEITVRAALESARSHAGWSTWSVLSRRVLFLDLLRRYGEKPGGLPENLRELFRRLFLPAGQPAEPLEQALARLADAVRGKKRYAIPRAEAETALAGTGKNLLPALVTSGLLRAIQRESGEESVLSLREVPEFIQFAHPLYLAYFTALGWYTSPSGEVVPTAEAFAEDPLLAEALLFFNHIESDPRRVTGALEQLAQSEGGLYLVTQCLLAMPAAARPAALVARAATRLVEQIGRDKAAVELARPLLNSLNAQARLAVLIHVIKDMDDETLEWTLRRVNELAIEAGRGLEEVRGLLWRSPVALAVRSARVWAFIDPASAFPLFRELYERGPAERRPLAMEMLGMLPHEAVEEYLDGLLQAEKEPAARMGILASLVSCGASVLFTLLELVADAREADEVRIFAAKTLAGFSSPDMHASSVVREIVRISRVPMPELARSYMSALLDSLRSAMPAGVQHWEAVANPYVIGRPVTDPAMFFGRDALLRDLRVAVENGTHVLLHGERRIGKTSLLRQLQRALKEESRQGVPLRAISLDLQGLQPHEFFETLIRETIEQLREPGLFADPQVPRPYTDKNFARDLHALIDHLKTSCGPGVRLVLLLDEADVLESYTPVLQAALRRIFTGEDARNMVVIAAGMQAAQLWAQTESPFFNLFAFKPIPRLTAEEAARLVVQPVVDSIQYTPDALNTIVQATQGRPYEIQLLCQGLVSELLAAGQTTVTAEIARKALASASGSRGDALAQADRLLVEMFDWLEENPRAGSAQVEERLKHTFEALQKSVLQAVIRQRQAPRN